MCNCNDNCSSSSFTQFTGKDGTNGTNGVDGENGTNGTNGDNAFKYVKETNSSFDGDVITISQVELAGAGILPTGFIEGSLPQEYCDLHIQIWYLSIAGTWVFLPFDDLTGVSVNDTTGLVYITLDRPVLAAPVRVRVVVLG